MTDRELLEQALEALEYPGPSWPDSRQSIAAALRERLAQPEQEPVAWRTFDGEGGYDYRDYEMNEDYRDEYIKRNGIKYAAWVEPLYTTPPRREWVGLTEEEGYAIFEEARHGSGKPVGVLRGIRAIEAKLREENA